jgi:type IX secretion system PorP/SprF family membrane protein
MKIKLFIFAILLTLSTKAIAQDPVFTQYFLVPETLNPGFTGFLNTPHAGILHRTHWWPDGDRKLDTEYAFFNTAVSDFVGLGITVLNHKEDFTGYNYLQLNGAFSYWVPLNDDWSFRPGLEAGYGRKDFGFGNLLLEDQIDPGTGTTSGGSVDPGVLNARSKISFFDVSAGFVLDRENAWFGATLKHLNRPDISFTDSGNSRLDMFLTIHGGYTFEITDSPLSIFPDDTKLLVTANFMKQSQYNRFDVGTALVFEQFTFGATAATNVGRKSENSHYLTSINPFGSVQLGHFIVGASYDFNTSAIGRSPGMYELSITWQHDLNIKCSGCPNYKVQLKSGGRAGYQRR